MMGEMFDAVLLTDSTASILNLSTRSPSWSTVVWMVALCLPRFKRDVPFVGINVDVWGTPNDVEVDMWAAPICWCIVLVLGVIPAIVGVCVMAGNGVSLALSSTLLGGTDKVLPEGAFIGVLLVNEETTVPADPLHGWLLVSMLVALFTLVDIDTVHPVGLSLGESEATTFANVKGGVSKDPSAIIAVIVGTGVDVMVSLQSHSDRMAYWSGVRPIR
jgi:hypothetical protein